MPLLFAPSPAAIFFILIGLNFGYAFMYACLPGIINRYSTAEKSVTNGIFLTMYYLSGAIGSYFPTLIFENCGFSVYWICMFAISAIALLVAFQLRNITIDSPR
jgi:YNFM family putative membrane transporter